MRVIAELRDQGIWCVLFPKRAVFLNCVITGFRSRDAEQIVAAYRLIDAIQVCEGRTMRPKAGVRPTIKPKTVEEGMLRLQRLSEKWSALYQPLRNQIPQ